MLDWLHSTTGATPSGLIQGIGAVFAMLLIGYIGGTGLHKWTMGE
jgi:hypothetical protein